MDHIYCTDADLAELAPQDLPSIVPADQCLARGVGASIGSDGWTLADPSMDFRTTAIGPGNVVWIYAPKTSFATPGELYGIASVNTDGSLTLARRGLAPGQGMPPGAVEGVAYQATTARPQILATGRGLDRIYGIDDLAAGRRFLDLADPSQLRDVCTAAVLERLYEAKSQGTAGAGRSGTGADSWQAKADYWRQQASDLLARVALRWNDQQPGWAPDPPTTRFATRISR